MYSQGVGFAAATAAKWVRLKKKKIAQRKLLPVLSGPSRAPCCYAYPPSPPPPPLLSLHNKQDSNRERTAAHTHTRVDTHAHAHCRYTSVSFTRHNIDTIVQCFHCLSTPNNSSQVLLPAAARHAAGTRCPVVRLCPLQADSADLYKY